MTDRGSLRVYLGAAPGVGKTHAMVEEGRRLRAEGRDVAVAFLESHGRAEIESTARDLPVVPRTRVAHKGADLEEMDLEGVLSRRPQVALVDELAHTNAPGVRHDKRWQDVEVLLEAGIDVITTLNIQHLESLNDVVFDITGVTQRETIPDEVVRRADQIELIDLTQEGISDRLSAGKIYPAEQVDAAVANYFRPGNLAALRELALSWTADRVDEALARYRELHGIAGLWETRERVVVALAGAEGGDRVVRRAARMAMKARAELLGVFVRPPSPATGADHSALGEHRALLERLGGRYYEIVGDDIGATLLAFAKGENASQLVLGASRRSRLQEWLRGSPTGKVIREAGPLDIHIISYESARRLGRRQTASRDAIGWRRRGLAWLLALLGLPLLTWVLVVNAPRLQLHNILLLYLLASVAVGALGGVWVAVVAAGSGFLLANWFFTDPVGTWTIADPGNLISLSTFLLVAVVVGSLVGMSARRSAEARRARAQAEALAAAASRAHTMFGLEADDLTRRIQETFALKAAAILQLVGDRWEVLSHAGPGQISSPEQGSETIQLAEETVLVLMDGKLTADDRRVLKAFAAQIAHAVERKALEEEARAAEEMIETDRLRTALLEAVSHDLRTPLATIKASVTSLLETDVPWQEEEVRSFHTTIREETERLDRIVGRLLDASRIQTGSVHVFYQEVGLDEVVSAAVAGMGPAGARVCVEVAEDLPRVQTDPALLERAVANLIENAVAWSPPGGPVRVVAGQVPRRVDLRIIDRGPGIPAQLREQAFRPFHRLPGGARKEGVGLGLTVARGFIEAMGHELLIEDTPGGGTTMVIGLKPAGSQAWVTHPASREVE